jgi:RimJ/RimL family protein N-acetyltransferase
VLRCWTEADAPLLDEAIRANLDHLRPWMPWAHHEPEPMERRTARLRRFRRRFEAGDDFTYGIFDHDEKSVLGGAGLHRRIGAGAIEIGYWIHVDHVGQGLATEAAAALTRVGFCVLGLGRIEIHCEVANAVSAAVPARLGYTHQVTIPGQVTTAATAPRDMMVWTMRRDEFDVSNASRTSGPPGRSAPPAA